MHPEARLHALARQADAGQAPATQESEKIISVLDPDARGFCSLRSGTVMGIRMRIRVQIQKQGSLPKLTNKPDFQPSKKGFDIVPK